MNFFAVLFLFVFFFFFSEIYGFYRRWNISQEFQDKRWESLFTYALKDQQWGYIEQRMQAVG